MFDEDIHKDVLVQRIKVRSWHSSSSIYGFLRFYINSFTFAQGQGDLEHQNAAAAAVTNAGRSTFW